MNPAKYHTFTLSCAARSGVLDCPPTQVRGGVEDCNLCEGSLTKYKGDSKFKLSSSATDKVEVGKLVQNSLRKKPSNISKSLGRETKDSHSFAKKEFHNRKSGEVRYEGGPSRKRNYSTLISLQSIGLKKDEIPVGKKFEKYNALTPFKRTNKMKILLPPIYLTKTLIYSLDKSEDCLSKLSGENLVKRFLLGKLEEKFKITVKLEGEWRNLLNIVKSKDPYIKEPIYQKVGDRLIHVHTNVSFTEIDFSSFPRSATNIFKLSKIYGCLEGRFVNNSFEFIEVKKDKSLFDDSEFIPCGCYMIYSKKTLYYYIGYSTNILDRLNTHYLNLKSLRASRLGDL